MSRRNDDEPSLDRQPLYQTDLEQTPLPEILFTIYRHLAPGVLECVRGSERKRIYVDAGQIVYASSNQVRDSLGDKLLREGKITRAEYDESVRRLVDSGKRQGVILSEMGVIDPATLFVALREQIDDIVWPVFSWNAGRLTFTPGRDKQLEFVKLDIAIPQAIVFGCRHMPDPRALLTRIGTRTTVLIRNPTAGTGVSLDEDEQRLLEAADGKRSLAELVETGPLPAGVNARLLYAFFVLQWLSVKKPTKVQVKTGAGWKAS